jgi:hypothetical protein
MPQPSRSKFKKKWCFLLLVLGLVLFYKPIVLIGCKVILKKAIPPTETRTVHYKTIQWEEGAIVVSGLQIQDVCSTVLIDRIEMRLQADLLHLLLKPHIKVMHPHILLSGGQSQPVALPLLYYNKWIQPEWEVKEGELQLPSAQFFFTVAPETQKERLSSFTFSDHLNSPMISGDLAIVHNHLQIQFKCAETALDRLLPLATLIPGMTKGWEKATGEIEWQGLISFDTHGTIQELQFYGAGKKWNVQGPAQGINLQCEEIRGAFAYPSADAADSFWNQLSAFFYLKEGSCHIGTSLIGVPLSINQADVELKFEAKEEPEVQVTGILVQEGQQFPFSLSGTGKMQAGQNFWSEVKLDWGSSHYPPSQGLFSFTSTDGENLKLHLKMEQLSFEHLDFLRRLGAFPGKCVEGTARFEATLFYQEKTWQKMVIEEAHFENSRWYFPNQQLTVYAQNIANKAAFKKQDQHWKLTDLTLQIENGDYLSSLVHVEQLVAQIDMVDGQLAPSCIQAQCGQLKGEVLLSNPHHKLHAQCKIEGDAQDLMTLLSRKPQTSLPIAVEATADVEREEIHLAVEALIAQEAAKATLTMTGSLLELCSGKQPSLEIAQGQFQAERLTEKSYRPFLALVSPELGLNGLLSCKAQWTNKDLQLQIGGEALTVKHPLAELTLSSLHQPAHFHYHAGHHQWRGEIPLNEAQLLYPQLGLELALDGMLKLEGDHLKADSLYAECEGMALRGHLDFSLSQGQLSVSTSQIAGDMNSLLAVLSHFPALPRISLPISGEFTSHEHGFVLNTSKEAAEWSFKADFNRLAFPLNDTTHLSDGRCELQFDSKSQKLTIEKGEATWRLRDGMPFVIQVKRFSTQLGQPLDFLVKVIEGKKEFAQFEGKAQHSNSHWEVTFDKPSTHFGGAQLNVTRCTLDEHLKPISFEMKPQLRCQDLPAQASFLQNAGFLPLTFSPQNLQDWQLEGVLQALVASEDLDKGFAFRAESQDLKVKGKNWPSFHLQGQKIGEKWFIEKFVAGHLSLKGAFLVDARGMNVPQFEGYWHEIQLKGSGYVKPEQKYFACTLESLQGDLSTLKSAGMPLAPSLKGTFIAGVGLVGDYSDPQDALKLKGEANFYLELEAPLSVTGTNVKPVKFTYAKATGFVSEGIDLQLKHRAKHSFLARITAGRVHLPEQGGLSLQQLQFALTPALMEQCMAAQLMPVVLKEVQWEGNLEGSGEMVLQPKTTTFQGTIKPGRYGFKGKFLPFDQLHLRYEQQAFSLRAKTKINEQPLWAALQVDLQKEPHGVLKLLDHPKAEGLKVTFSTQNGLPTFDSIQGNCYGVHCQLAKNPKRKLPQTTVLSGEIKIDGEQVYSLFPEEFNKGLESFKFGTGYQWQGDLIFKQGVQSGFQASGLVKGHDFELLGYRFQRLEGTLEANSNQICLSQLKIEDAAGTIAIKKIELNKQNEWQLYIPHIHVRQLQPSLMRKVEGEPQAIKPFTIKNFTMTEIRGRLGDKSTLEGSGHLSFVNQFKKEASIFDTPLEMIKKIGLDPGLLTPIQGELDLELRGDKFYLMSLQNSFSEGNRAEFYLAPHHDLSYIDLDGKMHIDLNMRQDVVLKITEPFTLTIRGTLDKPRYGLQF